MFGPVSHRSSTFAALALGVLVTGLAVCMVLPSSGPSLTPILRETTPATGFADGKSHKGGGSCTGGGTVTPTTSSNWGGYAVETCLNSPASGVVSDVKGTWTEPSVTCTAGETAYSSFWVGIDGYSSGTVEQTGTDSDCHSGTPTYYAWYEMYPKSSVNIALTILPGDTISAEVHYQGSGNFVLTLTDVTSGQTFQTTKMLKHADRSSAEWIDEAPSGGGILPLADFGTVHFSNCAVTLNGVSGSIVGSAWQTAQITMSSSGTVKATTSAVTSPYTAFSATWVSS